MNWVTAIVLYTLIWWVSLFAVLPIGTRPVEDADDTSGWRGAPQRPRIMQKVIVTTAVATVVFAASYWLIESDFVSFRHGIFAAPDIQ